MDRDKTPNPINDLLSALADGELDVREHPDALAQIAQDAQASQRVVYQQQLKQACAKAMDTPEMKCPEALAGRLRAMGTQAQGAGADEALGPTQTQAAPYAGPSVIARIGRWFPAAVAAVLLIAAGVMFSQSNPGTNSGVGSQAAAFLPVDQIDRFTGRHGDCSMNLELLYQAEKFGDANGFDELPSKIAGHFKASTDGMRLSLDGIGYQYELTGACPLPGKGAVHVVYRHKDDAKRAISLWIKPAETQHAELKPGQVYSVGGSDPLHPIIIWREGNLLYYLVGDSLEDCDKAVKELRQAA